MNDIDNDQQHISHPEIQKTLNEYLHKFKCKTCDNLAIMGMEICPFCLEKLRDKNKRFWNKESFWRYMICLLLCPVSIFVGIKWGIWVQIITACFFVVGVMILPLSNYLSSIVFYKREITNSIE